MQENFPPRRPIPPRPVLQKEQERLNELNQQEKKVEIEEKPKRQPLNDQSKSIIFGLLGGFALLGGIAILIVMLVI